MDEIKLRDRARSREERVAEEGWCPTLALLASNRLDESRRIDSLENLRTWYRRMVLGTIPVITRWIGKTPDWGCDDSSRLVKP